MVWDENLSQKIQAQAHVQKYFLSWSAQNLEQCENYVLDIVMVAIVFD
jgi:hypothetical protein